MGDDSQALTLLAPSNSGSDGGRDRSGRFAPGNRLSRGNAGARKTAAIRRALFAAVRAGDIREVVHALLLKAKGGDVQAAKELFDRLLGKTAVAIAADIEDGLSAPLAGVQFYIVDAPSAEPGQELPDGENSQHVARAG